MQHRQTIEKASNQPSTTEKAQSALLLGALVAGAGVAVYVASDSLSDKTSAVCLGLVALTAVPEVIGSWRDMVRRGQPKS